VWFIDRNVVRAGEILLDIRSAQPNAIHSDESIVRAHLRDRNHILSEIPGTVPT
jgi:hypothetical protein